MEKAKARIRRKAKALMRWQRKKGLTADKAAKGNYRISYETLKDWGYCSMVNAYYKKGYVLIAGIYIEFRSFQFTFGNDTIPVNGRIVVSFHDSNRVVRFL